MELGNKNVSDFLRPKAVKALLGKGCTGEKNPEIEIDSSNQARGGSRIDGLTLDEVGAYWIWQCYRGNKQALSLCFALITESLERRFDGAFGVERGESARNERLQARIENLERDLQQLGDGLAFEDLVRQERDFFMEVLRQHGIDPYGLSEVAD